MNPYNDIELVCLCGEPFVWSAGEQTFINDLYEKGKIPSVQQPKRCVPCRKKKKEQRERKDY
ncbi:MAG: hypothetical protein UW07_C0019G0008 [Candidatus Nomurabacteria bacterium GW2011_GWF2_43_8]|uniref:Probable zinc-binding domain-containing protein n=3 Tax=Parcubacteria group TaxID=1794811 RepID=A0A0G1IL56_9BACT|nr:MAG: hypothetical protein UW02_C0002G0028 [Candidatus Nomurabacteria bacterium GW2011_GWB1_43_7]KKT23929.1 MAG: hypothetical protein UW07_C0019G0008 [Candidatus Nomurabacteria bacterium GW2011_GWF2_43_8]KKU05044.1 MAG: hypothetical protein UX06_C0004G0012 [Candidatus Giovannonibacteria bacterium GW2011_GWA2_45_21]